MGGHRPPWCGYKPLWGDMAPQGPRSLGGRSLRGGEQMPSDSPQWLALNADLLVEVLEKGGGALLHHSGPPHPCPQVGHEPLQEAHEVLSRPDAAGNCLCGPGTVWGAQVGSTWHSPHTPRRGSGAPRTSILVWKGGCGALEAGVRLGAPQRAQGSPCHKRELRDTPCSSSMEIGGALGGTSKERSPPHVPCKISSGSTGLAR